MGPGHELRRRQAVGHLEVQQRRQGARLLRRTDRCDEVVGLVDSGRNDAEGCAKW